MKKLFFTLFVSCILFYSGFAQCQYEKNVVDDFTGTKTASTVSDINKYVTMKLLLQDNKYKLYLFIVKNFYIMEPNIIIGRNDSVLFKFSDGAVFSAFPINEVTEKRNAITPSIIYIDPLYSVDPKLIAHLSEFPLSKMRVMIKGKNLDVEIKEKNLPKIQQAATCILSAQ
jgi:hypothetical protein